MVFTYGPLPILTRYSCSEVVDGNVKLGVKVVFNGQWSGRSIRKYFVPGSPSENWWGCWSVRITVVRRSDRAKSEAASNLCTNMSTMKTGFAP